MPSVSRRAGGEEERQPRLSACLPSSVRMPTLQAVLWWLLVTLCVHLPALQQVLATAPTVAQIAHYLDPDYPYDLHNAANPSIAPTCPCQHPSGYLSFVVEFAQPDLQLSCTNTVSMTYDGIEGATGVNARGTSIDEPTAFPAAGTTEWYLLHSIQQVGFSPFVSRFNMSELIVNSVQTMSFIAPTCGAHSIQLTFDDGPLTPVSTYCPDAAYDACLSCYPLKLTMLWKDAQESQLETAEMQADAMGFEKSLTQSQVGVTQTVSAPSFVIYDLATNPPTAIGISGLDTSWDQYATEVQWANAGGQLTGAFGWHPVPQPWPATAPPPYILNWAIDFPCQYCPDLVNWPYVPMYNDQPIPTSALPSNWPLLFAQLKPNPNDPTQNVSVVHREFLPSMFQLAQLCIDAKVTCLISSSLRVVDTGKSGAGATANPPTFISDHMIGMAVDINIQLPTKPTTLCTYAPQVPSACSMKNVFYAVVASLLATNTLPAAYLTARCPLKPGKSDPDWGKNLLRLNYSALNTQEKLLFNSGLITALMASFDYAPCWSGHEYPGKRFINEHDFNHVGVSQAVVSVKMRNTFLWSPESLNNPRWPAALQAVALCLPVSQCPLIARVAASVPDSRMCGKMATSRIYQYLPISRYLSLYLPPGRRLLQTNGSSAGLTEYWLNTTALITDLGLETATMTALLQAALNSETVDLTTNLTDSDGDSDLLVGSFSLDLDVTFDLSLPSPTAALSAWINEMNSNPQALENHTWWTAEPTVNATLATNSSSNLTMTTVSVVDEPVSVWLPSEQNLFSVCILLSLPLALSSNLSQSLMHLIATDDLVLHPLQMIGAAFDPLIQWNPPTGGVEVNASLFDAQNVTLGLLASINGSEAVGNFTMLLQTAVTYVVSNESAAGIIGTVDHGTQQLYDCINAGLPMAVCAATNFSYSSASSTALSVASSSTAALTAASVTSSSTAAATAASVASSSTAASTAASVASSSTAAATASPTSAVSAAGTGPSVTTSITSSSLPAALSSSSVTSLAATGPPPSPSPSSSGGLLGLSVGAGAAVIVVIVIAAVSVIVVIGLSLCWRRHRLAADGKAPTVTTLRSGSYSPQSWSVNTVGADQQAVPGPRAAMELMPVSHSHSPPARRPPPLPAKLAPTAASPARAPPLPMRRPEQRMQHSMP